VSQAVLRRALGYLVQTGDRDAIAHARDGHAVRFGPLDPELAAMVEVRLAEIDRLLAAAREVGLRPSR
jgi:hypothetical protein